MKRPILTRRPAAIVCAGVVLALAAAGCGEGKITVSKQDPALRAGATVFNERCSGCHSPDSTVHAPELSGIFGRTIHLQDGRSMVADEAYLRDSILLPKKAVVAGYAPIMPSFRGAVTEDELVKLIAYLKALSSPTGASPASGGG